MRPLSNDVTRDVTVITVTWNSERLVPGLVASLAPGMEGVESWGLVAVDNASADDTVATVQCLAPHATVVQSDANRGYAAGINLGLRCAPRSRAFLLLNPDVRLAPGAVHTLLVALDEAGTGVAVPRLRRPDGSLQHSLRRAPSLPRVYGEAVLGGDRAGRVALLGEVVRGEACYTWPSRPSWASGAAMLVSRHCLERVGWWDESFFLYGEETDFCLRAGDAGLAVRYCPGAEAEHIGGQAHDSPALYSLLMANRARLYARRHGRVAAGLFRGGLAFGEAIRAARGGMVHRAALRRLLRTVGGRQPRHARGPTRAAATGRGGGPWRTRPPSDWDEGSVAR